MLGSWALANQQFRFKKALTSLTMLPPSTVNPKRFQHEVMDKGTVDLTLLELLDEVSGNLLQLLLRNCELLLQFLDFLQQVLRHIGHGA